MSNFHFGVRAVIHGDEPIRATVTDYAAGVAGPDACRIATVTVGDYSTSDITFQGDPEALIAFVDRLRNAVILAVANARQSVPA